jgi:hypothetical protein
MLRFVTLLKVQTFSPTVSTAAIAKPMRLNLRFSIIGSRHMTQARRCDKQQPAFPCKLVQHVQSPASPFHTVILLNLLKNALQRKDIFIVLNSEGVFQSLKMVT